MLRVLLLLLAIIASVVAVVFDQPLLYAIGGLLVLVFLILAAMRFFRRKPDPAAQRATDSSREEGLSELGIVEIKPRTATRAVEAAPDLPAPVAESVHGVSPPTVRIKTVSEVHTADSRLKKGFLEPFLHSLQTAIDATTVALLRQEAPLRYGIEGVYSRNSYARGQGVFQTREPLYRDDAAPYAVSLHRVGEKGMATTNLQYYLEPIAVRQVAVVEVPHGPAGTSYLLLADSMEEGGMGTRRQRHLLEQYARLLGSVLDQRDSPEVEEDEESTVAEVRPRREIIAEEMRAARAEERDLALALVYLNHAERVAEGGAAAVLATEEALETQLRSSVEGNGSARVERFGELNFGVFYRDDVALIDEWAMQLQTHLAEAGGALDGGVSIGIAILHDRHQGPDALRADASHALEQALETGGCVIVG